MSTKQAKLFNCHFFKEKSLSIKSINDKECLKFELIIICKKNRINSNGTKKQLKQRIKQFLNKHIE